MILSNVNIGTGPSSGDGDPLRSAFSTINNNFQKVTNNVNALTNSVTSVAGRTGNIVLTVNDVIGAASVAYVNSQFANAGSYSNINVTAFLPSYAGSIATVTQANLAMKGYVDASVAGLIDSAPGTLDTLNELAAALGDDPNLSVTLTNTINSANTTMKSYVDGQVSAANTLAYSNVNTLSYLTTNSYSTQTYVNLANVTLKSYVDGQISAANSAVTAANLGMKGYVDSVAGQSAYGNADVAGYLTVYGGNVRAANIIFDDLSIQTTAYTGTQWRSNLESNVTVKPSWLSYVPGGKNQEGTQYGFDAGGMFFTSNADNDFAYPIQTGLHFHQDDVLEVIASFHYTATNNDHGLCIFSTDTRPIWRNGIDGSRIAFQYNTGIPLLYGQTTANTAPGSPVLSADNYYTIKFTYDPTNTVTVETFSGNTATGSAIDTRTISEVLPAGDYKLGFDADNDSIGVKSYWTNVTVRTLTNTVVNDLEVQGQVIGDLIPSANVTYSLGNITHQWNDLFVSNSTIYMGGTALSITDGNLTVGGNVVGAPSDSIVTGNSNVAIQPDGSITVSANNSSWSFGSIQADALSWPDGTWQATAFQGTATTAEGMSNVGNVAVTVDPLGSNYVWTYDTNGDTTMPGNLTVSNIAVQGKRIEFANGGYIEEAEVVDGNASPLGYYGVALNSSDDGLISMNALDSNAVATSSVIVSNVSVQLNVANSTPGGSPLSWLLDQSSRIILPNGGVISNDSDNIELQSANNVNVEAIGLLNIYTDTAGTTKQWQFGDSGDLSVPGDVQFADSSFITDNLEATGDFGISTAANVGFMVNTNEGAHTWLFDDTGVLTLPGEGVLQSLNDTVSLVSLNTTSGFANSVYLGSSGGLGFSDQSAGGNWLEIFRNGVTPEIKAPTGNLLITTVVTGVSSNTWTYGTDGSITFPDNTVQTTAWTGSGGYSNVQVATYLPTYSGNISAGNVFASGTSGQIGYSNGGFVQQATSNATQVTSHFNSGNIQLMNINLGVNTAHTVAFACNKLTTNDVLVVKHVSGGLTSVYVDAYVATDGLAVIWMRNISGQDSGDFTPMLKYAIIRAPSS